jgi:DNA-binding GntR family transcriptional regulator
MPDPIPLRGTSLHVGVTARLRGMVFEHPPTPGEQVDEKTLASALQTGRRPLREALKVPAAEGLVELVAQLGSRVIALTDDGADEFFPLMALLEGRCAHEAATKANDAERAERAMHDPLMAQLRALRPLRQAERSAARAEGSRRAR